MKFTTTFSSQIKALIPFEKDEYLSLASLEQLADFLPDVNIDKNIDLLPIAFNACVANRVNKNGDVINTETALSIASSFLNKQINLEHNRDRVVGVILKAGFSEFGTDRPMSMEDVKNFTGPFNITLGGVVWKIVNPNLANIIEESSDITSENYQKISASWELGFDEYNIILLEAGEKNIERAITISSEEEIDKIKANLRSFGGTGKLDGKEIFRQVKNNVLALGIGLTENPAADVKGILSPYKDKDPEINIASNEETFVKNEKNCVKTNSMKLESIKDISDQNWSTLSASSVSDFVTEEMRKASEQFASEKTKLEDTLKIANDKTEAVIAENNGLKSEFDKMKAQLDTLITEKQAQATQELFNQRMASLEEEFQFDEEVRAEIAKEIKDLNEESFSAYHSKMKKMAKGLTKKQEKLPDFIKDKIEKKEKEAPEKTSKASEENVVEEALDRAEASKEILPNTTQASESLSDKYKKAFSIENFEIKL